MNFLERFKRAVALGLGPDEAAASAQGELDKEAEAKAKSMADAAAAEAEAKRVADADDDTARLAFEARMCFPPTDDSAEIEVRRAAWNNPEQRAARAAAGH